MRQSQSSLLVAVGGYPLFTSSRRQGAIPRSSAEAEYYSGVSAASEGMYIKQEWEHSGFEARMDLGWAYQADKFGLILIDTVTTNDDKADLGTKSLAQQHLAMLRRSCGLEVSDANIDLFFYFMMLYTVVVVTIAGYVMSTLAKRGWLTTQAANTTPPAPWAKRTRSVATQSQATYNYVQNPLRSESRFVPLPDREQGCWLVA